MLGDLGGLEQDWRIAISQVFFNMVNLCPK
jgi:hypothetical protein